MIKLNKIHNLDCLDGLRQLPEESIDCCVTSPPYWALRDYGFDGQVGLEPTFNEYVSRLCGIFDEVKRILKTDGTCWVNLGDTFYNATKWTNKEECPQTISKGNNRNYKTGRREPQGLPEKCLVMIPFRFAIEMVDRGWIMRNTVIWHKPNCMPSSAKDRFTVDFEYIFFFVKNKKYYFKQQYEEFRSNSYDRARMAKARTEYGGKWAQESGGAIKNQRAFVAGYSPGRNKRTVWTVNTKPFKEAHFAVYPEELIETPIKAGCPEGGVVLDPFMGSGTTALVSKKLGRNFIGFEKNQNYISIANKRLTQRKKKAGTEAMQNQLGKI